jgi:predicted metal-dependent hydrolase
LRILVDELSIPNVGKVKVYKNSRSRRISLKINQDLEALVVMPNNMAVKDAERFVNKNVDWLERTREKMRVRNQGKIIWDENTNFSTKYCDVKIFPSDTKYVLIHLDENLLEIQYPEDKDVKSEEVQAGIKFGITETLRLEAKDYLPKRLSELAEKFNYKYNKVFIKHQKTKWGSCSSKKNINLNLELMLLPDEMIDFVLLHELAHTKYLHHGKGFHSELNKITGGRESSLNKKLNKFKLILH